MNAAAFFTYIINFSDFNLVSFMPYTYNLYMGTSPCDGPCQPGPMTAPKPHSFIAYIWTNLA